MLSKAMGVQPRKLRRVGSLLTVACAIALCPIAGTPARLAFAASPCDGWTMTTLFSGLGTLEYLLPDGRGGLLISSSARNAVERLTRAGVSSTVRALPAPGAMVIRGNQLYVTTGDGAQSGTLGTADGTIERIDLDTLQDVTYSSGLIMPNGLGFSIAGDAYTTRDLDNPNNPAQVTKVTASDPTHPNLHWANQGDTNGVRVDPTETWLYISTTFNQPANVYKVRLSNPSDIELVASLANTGSVVPKGLDDMTMDTNGILYIAANGSGEVLRLDPITGQSCVLASGLQNPSAVEFGGGAGWDSTHLFVSGFDGTVRELTPPTPGTQVPEGWPFGLASVAAGTVLVALTRSGLRKRRSIPQERRQ
jgi:sugar lactone lactonase YvrE